MGDQTKKYGPANHQENLVPACCVLGILGIIGLMFLNFQLANKLVAVTSEQAMWLVVDASDGVVFTGGWVERGEYVFAVKDLARYRELRFPTKHTDQKWLAKMTGDDSKFPCRVLLGLGHQSGPSNRVESFLRVQGICTARSDSPDKKRWIARMVSPTGTEFMHVHTPAGSFRHFCGRWIQSVHQGNKRAVCVNSLGTLAAIVGSKRTLFSTDVEANGVILDPRDKSERRVYVSTLDSWAVRAYDLRSSTRDIEPLVIFRCQGIGLITGMRFSHNGLIVEGTQNWTIIPFSKLPPVRPG